MYFIRKRVQNQCGVQDMSDDEYREASLPEFSLMFEGFLNWGGRRWRGKLLPLPRREALLESKSSTSVCRGFDQHILSGFRSNTRWKWYVFIASDYIHRLIPRFIEITQKLSYLLMQFSTATLKNFFVSFIWVKIKIFWVLHNTLDNLALCILSNLHVFVYYQQMFSRLMTQCIILIYFGN